MFETSLRASHGLHVKAGQGAGITLVSHAGEYVASFDCAKRCAQVLGDRGLEDVGDGIMESIPRYRIETEELNEALQKLAKQYSVSLIEYAMTRMGGRFVLIWKIPSTEISKPNYTVEDF